MSFFKKVVVFESGSIVLPQHDRDVQKIKKTKRKTKTVKEKSEEFVQKLLKMLKVKHIRSVRRERINYKCIELMVDLLPVDADEVLLESFELADLIREPVCLTAENEDFVRAGFAKMTREARILICRIIESQRREIQITKNGMIVCPHSDLIASKKEHEEMQTA